MPKVIDELDKQIISVAREIFLQSGIRRTEMKDIARIVNVSRSTLYRHFSSKEAIAFYVARDILSEFQYYPDGLKNDKTKAGYDKFEQAVRHYTAVLMDNPEKIRFLDEFDQLFTDSYPTLEEASDYIEFNQNRNLDIYEYYQEGITDGSIRPVKDPVFEVDVLLNLVLGMAQRIIPRAQHYVEEHGYSNEFLEEAVRLVLSAVKA